MGSREDRENQLRIKNYELRIFNYEDKDEIGQRISADLHEFISFQPFNS